MTSEDIPAIFLLHSATRQLFRLNALQPTCLTLVMLSHRTRAMALFCNDNLQILTQFASLRCVLQVAQIVQECRVQMNKVLTVQVLRFKNTSINGKDAINLLIVTIMRRKININKYVTYIHFKYIFVSLSSFLIQGTFQSFFWCI